MRLLRCAPWELRENEPEERLRERAEGVRVAYVAATRARDLLVVPAVGDEELDGWVGPLNKGIYPASDRYRNSTRAEGCPTFGEASIVDRPIFTSDEPSVRPGLHSPQQGPHSVVWWDPNSLKLAAPVSFGLRQEEILTGNPADSESPSLAAYRRWQTKRDAVTASAIVKRFDIFTATEAAEAPKDLVVAVTHESVAQLADRPAGPRFGTLVHTILRDAPLDADPTTLDALAEVHGRLLGASPEEIHHAGAAVRGALAHPLIQRSRQSGRVHREFPILLRLDASRVLEGVIDLLFEIAGRWHIVDFKTDADLAPNRAHYERQLQWYALAISRLNSAPVDAHLLSI